MNSEVTKDEQNFVLGLTRTINDTSSGLITG